MTADLAADIPFATAHAAHYGTSFIPEKRAKQRQQEYADTLSSDYAELEKYATTEEKRRILDDQFAEYRAGYRKRTLAWLHSESRCMSSMITGPSNFPVARNRKRCDIAHRRLTELVEYRGWALSKIRRALRPELRPIMAGDADALDRLAAKLAQAEHTQERMKAVNAAHKGYLKDPASLEAANLTEAEKERIRRYKPAYSWEPHPFAPFELTNNNANIRRMRERIEQIERMQATPETSQQGEAARLEDVPAENRVRLFFPGKPDQAIRERLKSNGFRWAPSIGCWQAYRNPRSLAVASETAGISSSSTETIA